MGNAVKRDGWVWEAKPPNQGWGKAGLWCSTHLGLLMVFLASWYRAGVGTELRSDPLASDPREVIFPYVIPSLHSQLPVLSILEIAVNNPPHSRCCSQQLSPSLLAQTEPALSIGHASYYNPPHANRLPSPCLSHGTCGRSLVGKGTSGGVPWVVASLPRATPPPSSLF